MQIIETLQRYDRNAAELYPRLLAAAGVTTDRESGQIVLDGPGRLLVSLGLPDLISRLECQQKREAGEQDPIARAKIWRHVAEACKPGAQIPDITGNTQLNIWLPSDYRRFRKELPARGCQSCGLAWEVCETHFSTDFNEQSDPTKIWLCYCCISMPEVRKRWQIESTERGECISCKIPWEAVAVGAHVPVKGSETDWRCAECVRQKKPEAEPVREAPKYKRSKRCVVCHKLFEYQRSTAQFCSDLCRKRASRRSMPDGIVTLKPFLPFADQQLTEHN